MKNELEKGIVHWWNLPKNNHVLLKPSFKKQFMTVFMKITRTYYGASKLTNISRPTIRTYNEIPSAKIRIDYLLLLASIVAESDFSLKEIEKRIMWIGHRLSPGVVNPKLPFKLRCREGARFLAAVCNEGWISDGAYYSNSEPELRRSVKKDTLFVFGGNDNTVREWIKEKDQYLAFPSIIRDVLILVTGFKGMKSINNPPVPSFLINKSVCIFGWLEQTIADEGHVRYAPEIYRREIMWRRSFDESLPVRKLFEDECRMLRNIGIAFTTYNLGTYRTKKGLTKVRMQIRFSRKENLLKLRPLITIPLTRKERPFSSMIADFSTKKTIKHLKEIQLRKGHAQPEENR
ncbi:hypothetical protein GOV07_04990 [Candidatus Woesearchaeota archaeon]|nr:hypothetical protein [Candidatus Woesearchaeota archaeon]